MSAIGTEQSIYASQFSEIVDRLPGRGVGYIDRLRSSAIDRFLELGFPTTRLEDWKYTNVGPIARLRFQPAFAAEVPRVPAALLRRSTADLFMGGPAPPAPRLVFVDGSIDRRLSMTEGADSGVQLEALSDALANPGRAAELENYLGRCAKESDHAFVAWNTAFFTDGGCVVIPAGVAVSETIHLIFISTGAAEPRASFPRSVIIAGDGSKSRVAEVYLSLTGGKHLTNAVTEIVAGEGANIDYYNVENELSDSFHVATVNADLRRDAGLTSYSVSLGAALVRNDLDVALNGEGAHCSLDGLFFVDGTRIVDNHTEIDHRKPHATSRELYKGILAGHGQGVFNGAIIVRKDAQKTDAVQHSRNLLLSEHAQINTKPQLEIRADDVRCAHGASIGQLDQESMFYLKTRGIDEPDARQMLVRGFAAEILNRVKDPLMRRHLEKMCDEWFQRQEGL